MLKPMLAQARQQVEQARGGGALGGQGGQANEAEMSKRQAKMKARQDKYTTVKVR